MICFFLIFIIWTFDIFLSMALSYMCHNIMSINIIWYNTSIIIWVPLNYKISLTLLLHCKASIMFFLTRFSIITLNPQESRFAIEFNNFSKMPDRTREYFLKRGTISPECLLAKILLWKNIKLWNQNCVIPLLFVCSA